MTIQFTKFPNMRHLEPLRDAFKGGFPFSALDIEVLTTEEQIAWKTWEKELEEYRKVLFDNQN